MYNIKNILVNGQRVNMTCRDAHSTKWTVSITIPTRLIPPLSFYRAVKFYQKISKRPYGDQSCARYIKDDYLWIAIKDELLKKIGKLIQELQRYYHVEIVKNLSSFPNFCLIKIYDVNNFV